MLAVSSWVTAGNTGGMTALAANLKNVALETQRKRLGVGLSFLMDSPWRYDVNFSHETKTGTKRSAGSFFFKSAQLVEPVDYVTDQLDAMRLCSADPIVRPVRRPARLSSPRPPGGRPCGSA